MTSAPVDASADLASSFEGKWSINLLLDRLFEHSRDQPCISYIKSTEPFEWQHVSGAQLDQCSKAATAYYAKHMRVRRENETCKQIGLLAESGFDFIVAQMAFVRLGYGVVLISPNNSVPAVVHLLKATGSVGLVVGPSKAEAAKQARELRRCSLPRRSRRQARGKRSEPYDGLWRYRIWSDHGEFCILG